MLHSFFARPGIAMCGHAPRLHGHVSTTKAPLLVEICPKVLHGQDLPVHGKDFNYADARRHSACGLRFVIRNHPLSTSDQ